MSVQRAMHLSRYRITRARPRDLVLLPLIELSAARLLAGHAPESVLMETTSREDFRDARLLGHLWVVLCDDAPVGFAHVVAIEPGSIHLEELDVDPAHARQGFGTQLVLTLVEWALTQRYTSITLTTFRDVPWNMPFYQRLGFEVVLPAEQSPALLAVVEDETRRGLDPGTRVVMRRLLASTRQERNAGDFDS